MAVQFILTDYVNHLMAYAVYDKLEDGTYAGRIPQCMAESAGMMECPEQERLSSSSGELRVWPTGLYAKLDFLFSY